jgi:hypothetical protein
MQPTSQKERVLLQEAVLLSRGTLAGQVMALLLPAAMAAAKGRATAAQAAVIGALALASAGFDWRLIHKTWKRGPPMPVSKWFASQERCIHACQRVHAVAATC